MSHNTIATMAKQLEDAQTRLDRRTPDEQFADACMVTYLRTKAERAQQCQSMTQPFGMDRTFTWATFNGDSTPSACPSEPPMLT
jgi:hypothetical protein